MNDLSRVVREIDSVIGLYRVKVFRLNDSMFGLGSRKDRHARIGGGTIGTDAIISLISHPDLCTLPFNLETPGDLDDGHIPCESLAHLRVEAAQRRRRD